FQLLEFSGLQPELCCLGDRHAAAFRGMDPALNLAAGINEPSVGVLLALKGLQVTLAGLVAVIGDPDGSRLVVRFPAALANRRHIASGGYKDLLPRRAGHVAAKSESQPFVQQHRILISIA